MSIITSSLWPLYAILCAFFTATTDALSKIGMRDNDEYTIGWIRIILALPFLLPLLFLFEIPETDRLFWVAVLLLLPLEVTAYILYLKAIKLSDLSITLPFLALTPVFTIATSFFILGEKVALPGAAGIFLVVIGAYLLDIEEVKKGIFQPLRRAYKEIGSKLMITVAFIYSITSNLGKLAIIHSSPTFFPVIYFAFVGFILTPVMVSRYNKKKSIIAWSKHKLLLYLTIGFIFALAIITHSLALSGANVAYMISLKRLSLVFGMLYGGLIFKEKNISSRLIGAFFMFLGALLITLA